MRRATEDDPPSYVFLFFARLYSHINDLGKDWERVFASEMRALRSDQLRERFKAGFAQAIAENAITPREFEKATGWDFDTPEEYIEHLRRLWEAFYPDEDPGDFGLS